MKPLLSFLPLESPFPRHFVGESINSNQRHLSLIEPIQGGIEFGQSRQRLHLDFGLQSSAVKQGQAGLIQEPARILDRLKACLEGQS